MYIVIMGKTKVKTKLIIDRGGLFRPSSIHRVTEDEYNEIKKQISGSYVRINFNGVFKLFIFLILFVTLYILFSTIWYLFTGGN